MPEIGESRSRLTKQHQVAIRWFVTCRDEEGAWPGTPSGGTLLASKAKGIYRGERPHEVR